MRYCSAIEAAWRVLGFDSIGRNPTVRMLHVHLQGQNFIVFRSDNQGTVPPIERAGVSELEVYFEALTNGPEAIRLRLRTLLYTSFHENFVTVRHRSDHDVVRENEWVLTVGVHQV